MTFRSHSLRELEKIATYQRSKSVYLHYVAPVLEKIPVSVSASTMQSYLAIPTAIWNAMVMGNWGPHQNYLKIMYDELEELLEPKKSHSQSVLDFWVQRKELLFPNEIWALEVEVEISKHGKLEVHAKLRVPYELQEHIAFY